MVNTPTAAAATAAPAPTPAPARARAPVTVPVAAPAATATAATTAAATTTTPAAAAPAVTTAAVPVLGKATPEELLALWVGQPGDHRSNFNAIVGRTNPEIAFQHMEVIHPFIQQFPTIPPGFSGYGQSVNEKELLMVVGHMGHETANRHISIYDAYTTYHNNHNARQLTAAFKGNAVRDLAYAYNEAKAGVRKHTFVEFSHYCEYLLRHGMEPSDTV